MSTRRKSAPSTACVCPGGRPTADGTSRTSLLRLTLSTGGFHFQRSSSSRLQRRPRPGRALHPPPPKPHTAVPPEEKRWGWPPSRVPRPARSPSRSAHLVQVLPNALPQPLQVHGGAAGSPDERPPPRTCLPAARRARSDSSPERRRSP